MLITLLSLLIALFIGFNPLHLSFDFQTPWFAGAIFLIGILTFFIFFISQALFVAPLQKAEQKIIPRLVEFYRKDFLLKVNRTLLALFPLISFVVGSLLLMPEIGEKRIIVCIWIVLFGLSLDLLGDLYKRVTHYLNPFYFVENNVNEAKKFILDGKDQELWKSLDTLSEVGLRAVQDNKLGLCNQVVSSFTPILHTFFASSKSITRINQDKETERATGLDEASYAVFYVLQRIELINGKSLEKGLMTVNSSVMMALGKIIIESAKFDLSMVSFPVHVLGKLAVRAQQYNLYEVTALGTSTLLEVSKAIINDIDTTYADLQIPFDAIINNLNLIAQTTFKKDKTINPKMLAQPFKEIKELFLKEKVANHRDTPAIIAKLDAVLSEYDTLEQVMRSIPPISP